jgi:hypothetical protein
MIKISGLPAVLFIIFLILKLVGAIAWSWWWVFSPLWMGVALTLVVLMFIFLFKAISKW